MRIAISGCGVAGPTLAYWLREYGHEAVLFEKASALRTGGYVIDFWGSGFKVATRMGIIPKLREEALKIDQLVSVNEKGRKVASLKIESMSDMLDGDYFTIARSELARQICNACADGPNPVETHFGVTLEAVCDEGDHVAVTRSDGLEERFDLVVGADGLHSALREQVFGAQTQFALPLGLHVAAFVIDDYAQRDEGAYIQFTRPHHQINRAALADGSTLVLMVFADHLMGEVPSSPEGEKAVLKQIFVGMGWEADAIMTRLDEADDLYFDGVTQIEMPRWTKGRVALIGDAAACASLLAGEGTGLAMTEAYILAGELHRAGGDHEIAFAAYEARLGDYVAAKQKGARGFKSFFAPESRRGIFLRDWGIRLANLPVLNKLLLGAGLTDQIELPDYG